MSKKLAVNNKTAGVLGFEDVVLLPGVNMVDSEVVKRMKAHPVMKAREDENLLEFPDFKESKDGVVTLEGKSVDESVLLIEATVDAELLEGWQKADKRKPVLKALSEQLAKLNAPTERRSDKSEAEASKK